jgi:predicted lipoprotein with Yx(FWY)xxD motif
MRSRILFAFGCVLGVVALVAAGCGGSDDNESTTATTATSAGGGAGAAVVSVADNPELGRILVDGEGNTLYFFEKDKGGKSSCDGACAQAWPPLTTTGDPTAEAGADPSALGTTKRSDGAEQVTYKDMPLYTYAGDKAPGDTNGNDITQFGAEWYALTPAATKPEEGGGGSGESGGSDESSKGSSGQGSPNSVY